MSIDVAPRACVYSRCAGEQRTKIRKKRATNNNGGAKDGVIVVNRVAV